MNLPKATQLLSGKVRTQPWVCVTEAAMHFPPLPPSPQDTGLQQPPTLWLLLVSFEGLTDLSPLGMETTQADSETQVTMVTAPQGRTW